MFCFYLQAITQSTQSILITKNHPSSTGSNLGRADKRTKSVYFIVHTYTFVFLTVYYCIHGLLLDKLVWFHCRKGYKTDNVHNTGMQPACWPYVKQGPKLNLNVCNLYLFGWGMTGIFIIIFDFNHGHRFIAG